MILVDTHVAAWLALEPLKISPAAASLIQQTRDQQQSLAIASISLWELAMMAQRGRIQIDLSVESFLAAIEENFAILPLTAAVAARSMQFSRAFPSDPMDRIIAATALVEGISLLTRDEKIRRSKEVACVW